MSGRTLLRLLALPFTLVFCLLCGAPGLADAQVRLESPDSTYVEDVAVSRFSGERAERGEFRISGPYAHDNLTLFLLHGAARDGARPMMTLEEAMEAGKLVVYETGSVNELAVENVGDVDIFIQASEIVKGGQQDRALAVDMIVPPKSGRVAIAAFCVERGRWAQRGAEDVSAFGSAKGALNSKELKMALRYDADQGKVWEAVAKSQEKLATAAGVPVVDERSASSLQLTLENRDVERLAEAYVGALGGVVEGKGDVIGYAFAINGTINSAEVYGSPALFSKLWRKMLRAVALEAAAERDDTTRATVTAADVAAALAEAEGGSTRTAREAGSALGMEFETERSLLFETRTGDAKAWVHRSYVTK